MGGSIAAASPTDIVWAPADEYAPYYTDNGGQTWNPVVLPGVTDWTSNDFAYFLMRSPSPRIVCCRTRSIFITWTAPKTVCAVYIDPRMVGKPGPKFILEFSRPPVTGRKSVVPGEAGNLFFTGGYVGGSSLSQPASPQPFMRSTNGGVTWTAVANVTDVSCYGYGAPQTTGGYPTIYIVGYVNNVYGVWQSNNNAQSWTQLGTWPKHLDEITTISGDPNVYGQVYLGFRGSGYAYLPATPVVTGGHGLAINRHRSSWQHHHPDAQYERCGHGYRHTHFDVERWRYRDL